MDSRPCWLPSIQELVKSEQELLQNQSLKNPNEGQEQSEEQVSLKFNSKIVRKVQEAELLSRFEFNVDKKFLVTAILTFIDHFVSKPREFELLNSTTFS